MRELSGEEFSWERDTFAAGEFPMGGTLRREIFLGGEFPPAFYIVVFMRRLFLLLIKRHEGQ